MSEKPIGSPKKNWIEPKLTVFGNAAQITGGDKGKHKDYGLSDGFLLNGHITTSDSTAGS